MRYMLDTNICIYVIKHKPEKVFRKIQTIHPEDVCISSVTYAELVHGVEKSAAVEKNKLALSMLLANMEILDFDVDVTDYYGKIRAGLEKERYADRPSRYDDCRSCVASRVYCCNE